MGIVCFKVKAPRPFLTIRDLLCIMYHSGWKGQGSCMRDFPMNHISIYYLLHIIHKLYNILYIYMLTIAAACSQHVASPSTDDEELITGASSARRHASTSDHTSPATSSTFTTTKERSCVATQIRGENGCDVMNEQTHDLVRSRKAGMEIRAVI